MTIRVATCSCGQLRAICAGEPPRVSICHCLECQKRTGSVFAAQARYASENVRVEGVSQQWSRVGDAGGEATFHFCPTCAATVYWRPKAWPDLTYVAIGAFADPTFPPPTIAVYEERQHPWTANASALEMAHHSLRPLLRAPALPPNLRHPGRAERDPDRRVETQRDKPADSHGFDAAHQPRTRPARRSSQSQGASSGMTTE